MSYGLTVVDSNSTPDERTDEFQHNIESSLGSLFGGLKNAGKRRLSRSSVRSAVSVPVLARTHRGVATQTRSLDLSPERRSGPVRMAHRRNRAHLALRACRLNAVFFRLHDRSDQSTVLLGSDDGNCGARFQ